MHLRISPWVVAVLTAGLGLAQNRFKPDINAETPEGKLLQEIGQTQEDAKRLELVDSFLAAHASHPSAAWAMSQAVASGQKLNQHDKVIANAVKLVALDGTDAEMAYAGLEAAVAKADTGQIINLANATAEACRKATASPQPKDEDDIERWKYRISFCKPDQAPKRAEYELFTAAVKSQDPAARVKLLEALMALNPNSEYLAQGGNSYYFAAFRQSNQNDKALAFAAKAAESGAADEDMLLFLANSAFEKKDQAGVIKYADQLSALLRSKTAPTGVDEAAWTKKKNITLGAGLWLKGMTLASQSKWKETDVTLREAVPLLQDNSELLSHALFNAGLANYKMGNLADALKLMQDCAALKGPKQAEAAKNAAVIRQQAGAPAAKKGAGKK
jgi:hypothetical protein